MSAVLRSSVVVPACDAAPTLARCLEAILRQREDDCEVIVVDDGSTDDTRAIAERFKVRSIALERRSGPAAARNAGAAAASSPLLFFLDADVELAPGGFRRAVEAMDAGDVDAVIGSYDAEPDARTMTSLFKNLAHHHFHQRSAGHAETFWSACGIIRAARFRELGGFDERRYRVPSIEDVELGYRLIDAGGRIRLDADLRVKHLKRWTLWSMLKTDLTRRAIPWTQLCLERGILPRRLNFGGDQLVAAALAVTMAMLAVATAFVAAALPLFALATAAAFWINRDLYRLFRRSGGFRLLACGFILQQLYYLYSIAGLIAGAVAHLTRGK